jgi:hypothetical protein
VGGDGGGRDAGGMGEVAAGKRALEQQPPLHRLRPWAAASPESARRRVVTVTSPAWACPAESGRDGEEGGGSSPRFPVSDIIMLSIGRRSYSLQRILVVIGVQRMDRIGGGESLRLNIARASQLQNNTYV